MTGAHYEEGKECAATMHLSRVITFSPFELYRKHLRSMNQALKASFVDREMFTVKLSKSSGCE